MQRITTHNSLAITPTSTNGKLLTFLPLLAFADRNYIPSRASTANHGHASKTPPPERKAPIRSRFSHVGTKRAGMKRPISEDSRRRVLLFHLADSVRPRAPTLTFGITPLFAFSHLEWEWDPCFSHESFLLQSSSARPLRWVSRERFAENVALLSVLYRTFRVVTIKLVKPETGS